MADSSWQPIDGIFPSIAGAGTILNDGSAANNIWVDVSNNNLFSTPVDLPVATDTEIYLWFVTGDKQGSSQEQDRQWALAPQGELSIITPQVEVIKADGSSTAIDWNVTADAPTDVVDQAIAKSLYGWKMSPKTAFSLAAGARIRIKVNGFKTKMPNGPSVGYLQYKTPAKTRGFTVGPVYKTSLIQQGQQVGIGVQPAVPLHVGAQGKNKEVLARIDGQNALELGGGLAKHENCGRIGYQIFSTGLDISGAGTNQADRRVTVWADAGTQITGPLQVDRDLSVKGPSLFEGDIKGNGKLAVMSNGYFKDIVAVDGTLYANGYLLVKEDLELVGKNTAHFGRNIAGKGDNAGKIGYQTFSDGLDIVGAGTRGDNRKINLWAEGGLRLSNQAPIVYKTLSVTGNSNTTPTGIYDNYNVFMGGFRAVNYDINEGRVDTTFQIWPELVGNQWNIRVDLYNQASGQKSWQVVVIGVLKQLC
ncbi:MAG: hypothetical protein AAF433_04830 [Bacteroidota bacterium]